VKFSAVILAGGKSRRMGNDKAFLSLDGKPLLLRQIESAREIGAEEIFISGKPESDYTAFGCGVLTDRFEDAGPLSGVERALAAASNSLLLVLAVDMPGMNAMPLREILGRCTQNRGAIPRVAGQLEPLAAVYPKSALKLATHLLENGRFAMRHFAERCVEEALAEFVDFSGQWSACFQNWNTPADVIPVRP
jgi:molybdopterin-guanine dinucleotide biosynthesis protein A